MYNWLYPRLEFVKPKWKWWSDVQSQLATHTSYSQFSCINVQCFFGDSIRTVQLKGIQASNSIKHKKYSTLCQPFQHLDYIFALPFCSTHHDYTSHQNAPNIPLPYSGRGRRLRIGKRRGEVHREIHQLPPRHRRRGLRRRRADPQVSQTQACRLQWT